MGEATTNEQEWARGMRENKQEGRGLMTRKVGAGLYKKARQREPEEKKGQELGEAGKAMSLAGRLKRDKKLAGEFKEKVEEAITAPARIGTSRLLQLAWGALIPSWGLSLFWINIHVGLKMVFGEKLFCKLGDEWLMGKTKVKTGSGAVEMAGRGIGLVEVMVLILLDVVALLIIGLVLASIFILVDIYLNPIESIWNYGLKPIYSIIKVLF